MINKLIIDGENVELTDKSQVPYTHTFAQADTHVVRYGLDNTDEICAYAFQNCTELSYIAFPPEIKKIKRGAFKGCTSLERIPIGENIEYIGKEAFDGCTSLEEVDFESANIPSIYCTFPAQTNIFVPDGEKYEEIPYSEMNLDGNTEYFTKNEYSGAFEKIYDVTFCNEEGTYYFNKWQALADNEHTIEYKNRYPVTSIAFEQPIRLDVGQRYDLSYTLTPDNVTNTQLYWYSSIPDVFSVNTNTGREGIVWLQATTDELKKGSEGTLTCYSESGVKFTGRLILNK